MQSITNFNEYLALPHTKEYKVVYEDSSSSDVTISMSDIVSIQINGDMYSQNELSFGNCNSRTISLRIIPDSYSIPSMDKMTLYMRLKLDSNGATTAWVEKGTFYVDTRKTDSSSGVMTLTGYDVMLKAENTFTDTASDYPKAISTVVSTIAFTLGINTDSRNVFPSYTMPYMEGYSMREILSYIATVSCGNFVITDKNELRLIRVSSSVDTIALGSNVSSMYVGKAYAGITIVKLKVDSTTTYTAGAGAGLVYTAFCPFGTQAIANAMLAELQTLSYTPYSCDDAKLNPLNEIGDKFTTTYDSSHSGTFVISNQSTVFDSLCLCDMKSAGSDEDQHEYTYETDTERATKRQMLVKSKIEYALGDSSTVAPTTGWSEGTPTYDPTKYLWQRITNVYADGHSTASTACIQSASGGLGEQGYGLVAGVTLTSLTESQWDTLATYGHTEEFANTSSQRGGCRINDTFMVTGTATDTGNSFSLVYQSTTASGNLTGSCIASTHANRGGNGLASITQTSRGYTYSQIESWIGITNDTWGGITSFSGQSGDQIFIAITVTDRGNITGYMRCLVKSYDSTTQTITVDDLDFMVGNQGQTGSRGVSVSNIAKTSTSGLTDTYTITYSDGTTSTYTVTNGSNGKGVYSISKTSTSGLVDTYTITYSDSTTSTFDVTNGSTGSQGVSVSSVTKQYRTWTKTVPPVKGEWTDDPNTLNWTPEYDIYSRDQILLSDGTYTYTTEALDNSLSIVANWCKSNDKTYINGGKIYTGSITSAQLNTDAITSLNYNYSGAGDFSNAGTKLDLANGVIRSPNFCVGSNGAVKCKGYIEADSGKIGNFNITNNGLSYSGISGQHLRMYENTGSLLFDFYASNGQSNYVELTMGDDNGVMSGKLDGNWNVSRLVDVPSSATDSGKKGDFAVEITDTVPAVKWLYICVDDDTWGRVALSNF